MDIAKLAKQYLLSMTSFQRVAGGPLLWKFSDILSTEGMARCTALSLAAHRDGNVWPSDWRFGFMREALGLIAEGGDMDDLNLEADIYTSDLLAWLSSNLDNVSYCDDAQAEGLVMANASLVERIQVGQWLEKREVLDAVKAHLIAEVEAL